MADDNRPEDITDRINAGVNPSRPPAEGPRGGADALVDGESNAGVNPSRPPAEGGREEVGAALASQQPPGASGARRGGAPAGAAGQQVGEWVPLAEAAAATGCAESWLVDRCRDGRLPSRSGPRGPAVPLETARALVTGGMSD